MICLIFLDFLNTSHLHPKSHLQVLPPCRTVKNPHKKQIKGELIQLQIYSRQKWSQLDQMQAQESEPEPNNVHTNSTYFVSGIISLTSNLLLSPKKVMINLFRTKIHKCFMISIYQLPLGKLPQNAFNIQIPISIHLKTYPHHIEPSLPN